MTGFSKGFDWWQANKKILEMTAEENLVQIEERLTLAENLEGWQGEVGCSVKMLTWARKRDKSSSERTDSLPSLKGGSS